MPAIVVFEGTADAIGRKRRDLEFLYLGYWIKNCDKMNYKRRYKPLEAYLNDQWIAISTD